ncbi:uncharacterized protein LOC105198364 isoform X1 [Solenopsis invicta]|uniref:uncharacterized protein LOC105198364 isoform X1 n=3 Tax=Solenopsis invicta TaxID=13686 RepID=UPI00193D6290|nr:uncharacterized protein LOC105198364 isoform X1 [Solenopsis invicta]
MYSHRLRHNYSRRKPHKDMIQIKDRCQYFNVNRILLLIVGLWPYQQSSFTTFQQIFVTTTFITFILFQLTSFLTSRCTSEFLMKVLSSATFFGVFMIKYNSFCFNIEGMKDLLIQLQHVHNNIKDKNEIAIIKKYHCIAKRYVTGLIAVLFCGTFAMIIVQFWTNMVGVDLSTNASKKYHFIFITEYFIDQEKYIGLIYLHVNAAFCIGLIAMIAIGAILIAYIQHICGMFRIASYRIEYVININILQNVTQKHKIWMAENIGYAVDIHRQAMKLMKQLMSILEIMMFCLIVCGIASLSLNLFQLVLFRNDIGSIIMPFVFVTVCMLYMFLANLMGQNIIDHNHYVLNTAYNVQWYKSSLHMQKMILFLLQRGTKEFTLNVAGLFDASMECFATLFKASVSYFTVIYSMR